MTYCLALRLDEGLVFMADTRTNAGLDDVRAYRKLHVLRPAPDRVFVLQAAGSLATTHEVLDRIARDLAAGDGRESLASVAGLFEAGLYVGRLSREISASHREALSASGSRGTATFILGGQIAGEPADLLLIYAEGNYIRASRERPFLQIGESKYGRFVLEVAASAGAGVPSAIRVALASMMTTARATLSVGPPYDVAVYLDGTLDVSEFRIDAGSAQLAGLGEAWERLMCEAVDGLPDVTPVPATPGPPDVPAGTR